MPLQKGSSQAVVSSNIRTLMHQWEIAGSKGGSHPETQQNSVNQAVAISLKKTGKNRTTRLANAKGTRGKYGSALKLRFHSTLKSETIRANSLFYQREQHEIPF